MTIMTNAFFWHLDTIRKVSILKRGSETAEAQGLGINVDQSVGDHTHGQRENGFYVSVCHNGEYIKILTVFNDVRVELLMIRKFLQRSQED